MKKNTIPRMFTRIVGKMLVDTSISKTGDILEITKHERGYLALNTRTHKQGMMFVSMMRNGELFEVIRID